MNPNQAVNRLFLLATAPFLGMAVWMMAIHTSSLKPELPALERPSFETYSVREQADPVEAKLDAALADSATIKAAIEKYSDVYGASSEQVALMLQTATAQTGKPAAIFENRIDGVFGEPIKHASSANIDLKLYSFSERNYKGFALKAHLLSDKAMKMALGGDKLGKAETTLSAAGRMGAIAGVNAGGFADEGGKRYPTGNTIQNGKYVYGFFPSSELAFVGLDANRKLVGGTFSKADQLDQLKPQFGASFTPVLLKDGHKVDIPVKWMTSPYRAARTVVGSFKNDQLLFIVAEGVNESGGSGASLAELQDKLQQLGIRDAYNLDGGGSSTLVWGGEVINHPSDGRMRPMPTHFLFFK